MVASILLPGLSAMNTSIICLVVCSMGLHERKVTVSPLPPLLAGAATPAHPLSASAVTARMAAVTMLGLGGFITVSSVTSLYRLCRGALDVRGVYAQLKSIVTSGRKLVCFLRKLCFSQYLRLSKPKVPTSPTVKTDQVRPTTLNSFISNLTGLTENKKSPDRCGGNHCEYAGIGFLTALV